MQASIHLKEIEFMIFIYKKLNSSCSYVVDGFCRSNCLCAHFHAKIIVYEGAWTFFNNFLVTTLYTAFSIVQVDDISVLVTQNLKLYVVWFLYKFFYINSIVTESCYCFAFCGIVHLFYIFLTFNETHTFASTTHTCFQHYRKTYLFGNFFGFFSRLEGLFCTRYNRYTCSFHFLSCTNFITHFLHRFRIRTDEDKTFSFTSTSKLCIL